MVDKIVPEGQNPAPAPSEGENPEGQKPQGRSAEDRINELLSKNKELLEKVDELSVKVDARPIPTPPTMPTVEPTPEVKQAIEMLKKTGRFVDQSDLESQMKTIQDRMILDSEHSRLEKLFNGEDGKPSYSRKEVEEYMRKRGVYDPEVAYKALHEDEILDWTIKKAETDRKKKPYVAKPGATSPEVREEGTISREKIEDSLKTPEGRAWYEQNRDKILDLMAKGQL